MADKAHKLTDDKLEEMEKRLSAIYSEAEKSVAENWQEFLSKSNAEIDELQKLYDTAKKDNDFEAMRKYGTQLSKAKRERTLLDDHYKRLTEKTAAELYNVNAIATAYVNGELPEVYALNYNELAKTVDGVGGYAFELVDADTVRHLALADDSLLPMRELKKAKDISWNMKKINSQVLQGILSGEPMDKIARRIGKVQEMNEAAAIRTARTIVTGAENKGRQDSYDRATKDGIILQKKWLATIDSRTRDWHRDLDGKTVDEDKPFHNSMGDIMFPGDSSARGANVYNCRCTMVAVVKGFKKAQVQEAMEENQITQPMPHMPKTQPREKITQNEWDVLEDYVSGDGMDINNFLRQRNGLSIGDMNASEKSRLSLMDKAMSKSELPKDQILYRSVDASAVFDKSTLQKIRWGEYSEDDLQEVIGKTITDKGFMSTTKDKEIAFGWGDFTGSETPIVIEFDTPKGTHGIDLKRFDIEGDEQKEILLDRDLSYDIKSVGTEKMRFEDEYGEYYESCIVVKAKIKKGKK